MSVLHRRRALFAALGVGVVVIALVCVAATRPSALGETTSTSLGGKLAPSISGRGLLSGRPVSLMKLRGKYVVVDFFASWCAPCEAEAPQLVEFLFEHRAANDVAVLGVDIDDSATDGAAFLRRVGATWPAIEDASGAIAVRYGVTDPPEAYLVSPSGVVIGLVSSGVTAAALDSLIDAARGAKS